MISFIDMAHDFNFVADLKGLEASSQGRVYWRCLLDGLFFEPVPRLKTPHYLPAYRPRELAQLD